MPLLSLRGEKARANLSEEAVLPLLLPILISSLDIPHSPASDFLEPEANLKNPESWTPQCPTGLLCLSSHLDLCSPDFITPKHEASFLRRSLRLARKMTPPTSSDIILGEVKELRENYASSPPQVLLTLILEFFNAAPQPQNLCLRMSATTWYHLLNSGSLSALDLEHKS